ncbi:MAG: xanthine dehydrogenase family protein subunit M [bacterium]|nr:xanthine dehydrogenase family protein subunit M [bacterium]
MKNFAYKKPKSLKEAGQLLGDNEQAALPVAGGTDLLGLIKDGILQPDRLVDLKSLPGLDKIVYTPGKGLSIGALVKIADVAEHPLINEKYPVLAQAAQEVASPQLRNQGTIGGNICQRPRCWYFRGDFNCLRKGGDVCFAVDGENKFHCVIGGNPCFIVHPSDTAVALTALDASVTVFYKKKSRNVPLADFFVLPGKDVTRENILKQGEIVTEIQVPDAAAGKRSGYLKSKERDVWDFATVSAAVVLGGRVVLGGVAPVPWVEKDAAMVLKDAEPMAQNGYKVLLARNLVKRLIARLKK